MKKPVIGLIGGMGSGKTRVAELLAARGAKVISGDAFGHEALRQPSIKERIVSRWGPGILDQNGNIDRPRLAGIVFADPAERRVLEECSFPWIERRIAEEIKAAEHQTEVAFIVLDAAIMLEAGWDRFCDRIIYVDAPRELRLQRLAQERGWTSQQLDARESAQWPLSNRRTRADWLIDNSGSLDRTAEQVDNLLAKMKD
jgi:dephospho-CoA kinase